MFFRRAIEAVVHGAQRRTSSTRSACHDQGRSLECLHRHAGRRSRTGRGAGAKFIDAHACRPPATGILEAVLAEPGVVEHHSDLYFRSLGADAYKAGDKPRALEMFMAAARFGDKPSEAMVAAMYWNGEGTAVDRPRAYAWMDLAADRGYRDLVIQRELYWNRLTPSEREQALAVGKDIYDRYSD